MSDTGKKLTLEQVGRLEDVIYTLKAGVQGKWPHPSASLAACTEVLTKVHSNYNLRGGLQEKGGLG